MTPKPPKAGCPAQQQMNLTLMAPGIPAPAVVGGAAAEDGDAIVAAAATLLAAIPVTSATQIMMLMSQPRLMISARSSSKKTMKTSSVSLPEAPALSGEQKNLVARPSTKLTAMTKKRTTRPSPLKLRSVQKSVAAGVDAEEVVIANRSAKKLALNAANPQNARLLVANHRSMMMILNPKTNARWDSMTKKNRCSAASATPARKRHGHEQLLIDLPAPAAKIVKAVKIAANVRSGANGLKERRDLKKQNEQRDLNVPNDQNALNVPNVRNDLNVPNGRFAVSGANAMIGENLMTGTTRTSGTKHRTASPVVAARSVGHAVNVRNPAALLSQRQ